MKVVSIWLNRQAVVELKIDKRVWSLGMEGTGLTRGLPSLGLEVANVSGQW